jgi:hypothetical protein
MPISKNWDLPYLAPEGMVWKCMCCGKTAKERTGDARYPHSRGWDESCFLNADLVKEEV